MADLHEILKSEKTKIQKELFKNKRRNRVNRDLETRPWSSRIPQFGLQEEIQDSPNEIDKNPSRHPEGSVQPTDLFVPGQFSISSLILDSIRMQWKITLAIWVIFLSISFIFVQRMPNDYFSTLYFFAPELTQSISSRLPLFTNRVEFASFPMELRIPISILSRQLRKEDARNWVIAQYLSQHDHLSASNLHLDEVRVEPGYLPATEILVIEGFAHNPEMAKEITELYGQYFTFQIKKLEDEHREKIREWLHQTNINLDTQIESLIQKFEPLANQKQVTITSDSASTRLAESFTNSETKRSILLVERDELLRAQNVDDLEKLPEISDRDIQAMIQIRRQLLERPNSQLYFNRLSQVESQIKDLISQKIREKDTALSSLSQNSEVLKKHLGLLQKANRDRQIAGSIESDLVVQIATLRSHKSEISKLKSQLELEPEINNVKMKVLQRPIAHPDSMRPSLATRYGVGFMIATMITLMTTIWISWYRLLRTRAGSKA